MCPKQSLGAHPMVSGRQQAGLAGASLPGAGGDYQLWGHLHQLDSSVTRETRSGDHPLMPIR